MADYGFDELLKSEFTVGLLERLGDQAALDEATRKAISKDWLEGKIQVLRAGGRESATRESHAQVARTIHTPPLAQKLQEPVQALCGRCKVLRPMRDPQARARGQGPTAA